MEEIFELFSPEIVGTPQGDLNVPAFVNVWRLATQDPSIPGYFFAVRMAVTVTRGMLNMAGATLGGLELDAFQQQAAVPLHKELAALDAIVADLWAKATSTADPSALHAAVVVPLLWKGVMARTVSLLNQIRSLRPGEVTYRWAGIEWSGPEHDWMEYASPVWGAGRIASWAYAQMQVAAPGEAPTVRDRLLATLDIVNRAAKTAVQAVKSTSLGIGELLGLGLALWVGKEALKG